MKQKEIIERFKYAVNAWMNLSERQIQNIYDDMGWDYV